MADHREALQARFEPPAPTPPALYEPPAPLTPTNRMPIRPTLPPPVPLFPPRAIPIEVLPCPRDPHSSSHTSSVAGGSSGKRNRSVQPVVCAHVERTPRRRPVSSAAPQPDIARTGHPHGQPAHHAHVASKKRRAVGALSFLPTEQAVWARAGANTRHSGQVLRKQCPANRARTAETDVKGDASMPHPILRAETIPHVPGESLRPCRRCRATSVPLRHPPKQTGQHQ